MSEIGASVNTRYLSTGANRYAAAADWGEDGLVAFGADTNVCLWNPSVRIILIYTPLCAFIVLMLVIELKWNLTNSQWTHCSCEGGEIPPQLLIPAVHDRLLGVRRR